MKLKVNGKDKEFSQETVNVTELLTLSGVAKPDLVSVQVNGNFIKRENFSSTTVKNGDEADFLFFMGGGGRGR
jgi:sulfur carrier protein